MKRLLFAILISSFLSSCNDGDIIVTSFNFDESNLNNCGDSGGYVFFNINNSSAAESISLLLETTTILFVETGVQKFELNGSSNTVSYRNYNGDISSNYFCSNIPPTSPDVILEYFGDSGTAELTTEITKIDDDGIEEDINSNLDTDGDELLNFYDEDDDGDNVPTLIELGNEYTSGNADTPQDTDGDGIFDYLDDDDDNDGVLTRNEDLNKDLDPTNDETEPEINPDYLNPNVSIATIVDEYRIHSYHFKSDISLIISNLVLINGEEEITQETMILGNQEDVINTDITLTPLFNN